MLLLSVIVPLQLSTDLFEGPILDIGILQESGVTVEMDGTKRFRANELDTVIEMKYIKNAKHYGAYQLQKDGENRIEIDLQRLSKFPDSVEKYFLLFANVDLFRETDDEDYTEVLDALKAEYSEVQIHYQPIPL